MKTLIVYDSVYGNTEIIARAIGSAIPDEVKVLRVEEVKLADLKEIDLLIIGSPTQGGRPTPAIQEFLVRIPEPAIGDIQVASFDTRLSTKWVGIFGNAAGRIAESMKKLGCTLVVPPEAFFVKGKEGPLREGEIERAGNWTKTVLAARNKNKGK